MPRDLGPRNHEGRQPLQPARPHAPRPALPTRTAYALAALAGALYFLAFPGVGMSRLAFCALAPLVLALRGQPARRATALGWVCGLVATGAGFYWLYDVLVRYGRLPAPLALMVLCLLCAYQAGRLALCAWLYARAARRGWPAAPAFAGAFATSELVFPLLFPWYLGAALHDVLPLLQVADLGGPILVGLVLVAVNLAVAEVGAAALLRAPCSRAVLLVGVGALPAAGMYGVARSAEIDALAARSPVLRVGLVQGNIALGAEHRALGVHLERSRELVRAGAELVVWSEAALPWAIPEAGHAELVEDTVTRGLGAAAVIGAALVRRTAQGRGAGARPYRMLNSALVADGQGRIVGRYDKQHLLPFGEYLPLGDRLPGLYELLPASGRFSPGDAGGPVRLGEHRLAVTICYEDVLPGYVRQLVRRGEADLLVNLTNDAWFGASTEPWAHLALAKLRAVEHHRYLVRATSTGVSAIIDPVGRVVAQSELEREQTVVAAVRWMHPRTAYGVLGDRPWWVVAGLAVIAGFVPRRRRAPRVSPSTPS
ncbi:MAG: apolipoprotein N-acyltransferase [Deltaproteobacteria bacterium]|nr:apolipoprotein N-acyltransferase [Deltaproteobacteria bacterium]